MSGPARILLIEDEAAASRLFGEAVTDSGIGELLVTSGDLDEPRALPTRSVRGFALPDLIFLDLALKRTDALAVLRELKAGRSAVRLVPVLAFSGSTDQELVNEAYRLGANAVLPKPDDYEGLLDLMAAVGEFWTRRVRPPAL